MKNTTFAMGSLVAALGLFISPSRATTNDLTSAIQRGLFEEEANQNLGAAIQAYQTVANQFDKDRKLAATAIFRLGECYRKQGNTNEAAAQYERVLREFSDQPTLVNLSRQNLASLGSAPPATGAPVVSEAARQEQKRLLEDEIKLVQKQLAEKQKQVQTGVIAPSEVVPTERDLLQLKRQLAGLDAGQPISIASADATANAAATAQAEALEMENQLAVLSSLPPAQRRMAVRQNFINPVLTSLMQKLAEAEQNLVAAKKEYGPEHTEVQKATALVETINKQIDEQVEGVLQGLKAQATASRRTADMLGAQSAHAAGKEAFASTPASTAASSDADEVKRIQNLIKDSPDLINAPNGIGETLLDSAAGKGKLAVVKLLLESGAAVDGLQQPGLTALHYAAGNGHKAVVDLLLSKGAKPGAQTEGGVTPLHLAAQKGYEEVAKALLAAGAPVNAKNTTQESHAGPSFDLNYWMPHAGQTPLHLAATAGFAGLVELLLAKGADVNAVDDPGRTALSYAVDKHCQPVVQVVVAAHANPNAGTSDLPLTEAAYYGDIPALKLLLANGADPNINANITSDFRGIWGLNTGSGGNATPLAAAISRQHPEAVTELIRAKGDPNGSGPGGAPLIFLALWNAPTLKALLEGGADANRPDLHGDSPLYQAVAGDKQAAVELLLAHKADVQVGKPREVWTPLHEAASHGNKGIAEVLLKAGADVNARAKDGLTPLHIAVSRDHRDTVELLLAHKGDPNLRDKSGLTPLDYAKKMAQQARPGGPGMAPGSPGQPLSVSTAAGDQEAKPESMADLLRRHGALDDLPHLDQIGVRRTTTGFSDAAFTKPAQDWSQFTLLELFAVQYGFLAPSPDDRGGSSFNASAFFNTYSRLPFPDLARLHISRPARDLKNWHDQIVDLTPVLESGDCAKDVRLEWGDVVEIPEADHPLNETWKGFAKVELANLKKCLARKVEIVVKGQATSVTLAPQISRLEENDENGFGHPRGSEPIIIAHTSFWLVPVLLQSKLVLISSDLSRVKVTRRDPATGQKREWVVDCSKGGESAPDLWLEDGDRIEVPEKSYASGAVQAEAAGQPSLPGSAPALSAALGQLPPSAPRLPRTAKPRQSEVWEQRATPDLQGRGGNTAVWTGLEMIVFGGEGMGTSFGDGARYSLAEDTWAMLPQKGEPSSRTGHAAVWTGKEMIIWGGFGGVAGNDTNRNDGAHYNPSTDTWKPMSARNAPEARFDFPAVWTGREMLVWGGYTDSHSRYQGGHADAHVNTGGRYDPSSDTWKAITTKGAPSKRCSHAMVWTGKEMIVWGGEDASKVLGDGARYNPAKDSWKPISSDGAASPRGSPVAMWTGNEMVVWGGSTREMDAQGVCFESGARYNPDRDTWQPISTVGAPKGRVQATAVWTGTEMVVWGGVNDAQPGGAGDASRFVGTGARYNPTTDTWAEMTLPGAPTPRLTSGVWTGQGLLVFGGYNGSHLNETWFYSPSRTVYPYAKE